MKTAKPIMLAICIFSLFGCGIFADGLVYRPTYDSTLARLLYRKVCHGKTITLLTFPNFVRSPANHTYQDSISIVGKKYGSVVQADSLPASIVAAYQQQDAQSQGQFKVLLDINFYPHDKVLLDQCDSVWTALIQQVEIVSVQVVTQP